MYEWRVVQTEAWVASQNGVPCPGWPKRKRGLHFLFCERRLSEGMRAGLEVERFPSRASIIVRVAYHPTEAGDFAFGVRLILDFEMEDRTPAVM